MSYQIYTLQESEKWDTIVCSFSNFDTYWLSGYVKAFKIHGDGEPLLFFFEDKDCRGINVIMKRDVSTDSHFKDKINTGVYFDASSPYGYGGWIIEGNRSDSLFSAYEDWCIQNGIISEFVRFHPVLKNHESCKDYYEVIPLWNTVVMDLSSPEMIWNNITSKNRNMIRKALKKGVTIYNGRFPEIYEEFRKIYNITMDKDDANDYYYFEPEFYKSILIDLPMHAQVFYAVYEDKIIAASIMLNSNHLMNYHLSGMIPEYSNLAPTNLLLYEAALWGNAVGCNSLYLGGGVGSDEDGLYKFKKSFYRKDDARRFYVGRKIFNQGKYNELLSMRDKHGIEGSNFFPLYRA